MRYTQRLLQPLARLTLFTREYCSLCETAKFTVSRVKKELDVFYDEVDIMKEDQKYWRDQYEFDVPVLHIESSDALRASTEKPLKLMHRFSEADVKRLVEALGR